MDYQGRSIKDGSTDPSLLAAIVELQNEVDVLQETVIRLGRTDQVCSVEAEVQVPLSPGQESFSVKQQVALVGLDPGLYERFGYAPDVRVAINGFNSPYLGVFASSLYPNNIMGIRWQATASDTGSDARFHVTGTASFELLFMNVEVALRARYIYLDGRVQTFDYNRTRVPDRSSQNPRVEYTIDADVFASLTMLVDLQYIQFYVVVKSDFGTSPMYTDTLTGGWDTQYRNYLRVQRVK